MNQFNGLTIKTQARTIFVGTVPASDEKRLTREELRKKFENDLESYIGGANRQDDADSQSSDQEN